MTTAFNAGGVFYTVDFDTRQMLREAPEVDRTLRGVEFRFGAVALAVKGLIGALALLKMARVADEARLLGARIEVAAGSIERGAEAMAELQRISARTETALAANATVFNRLNPSIVQMGGNTRDTLQIVELLGKAIKVSGASGVEAASAMTQFGQALGSGKLAGDELRSLLENAPYLMQQLAAGIGVPVGALKQLGEEGKLTADVVTAALTKAAARIDADFKKLPQTFEAAMGTLVDQLRRASEAGDTLTGTSAALTGVAKGASEAVGLFADQLAAAITESDKLGRNESIKSWAALTTQALSYVADGLDVVVRGVRGVGIVLAGVSAIADTIKRLGSGSPTIVREMLSDLGGLTDAPLAGAKMRERVAAMRNGTDGYSDRSDRMAAGAKGSTLRSTAAPDKDAAKAAKKAADERLRGELAQLEAEQRIRDEQDALTQKFYADQQKALEDANELANRENEEQIKREEERAKRRAQGILLAQGVIGENDEVARLQMNLEAKSALLAEYAAQDEENAKLYAEARVALEQTTQQRIAEISAKRQQDQLAAQSQMLTNYGALFGSLAEMTRAFEGEQSSAYKAMFAVSKAFAIADSIIKIQQGIANALSLPYPANIAAAASTAAAASSLVSTIQGTNFGGGRQYGGPASAGTMYRVNETGAPEMFVGSGGKQYMLPTTSGQVVPADQVGGGGAVQVVVHNYSGQPVSTQTSADGRMIEIAVGRAVGEVARQFSEHQGPAWNALSGSTNVRPRLG